MNILITGGLGNLGLWLTKSLLDAGHNLSVVGRRERIVIEHPNYKFFKADITNVIELKSIITCSYDICIHTASYNEHFEDDYARKALLVNALGTEYLCQALLVNGVGKLIYLSTFHVYGVSEGKVVEDGSINPNNDYGLTHYFAEKYIEKHAKKSNLNYVIFRLTNSYGCPEDVNTDKWYLILNDLCRQAVEHKVIKLTSNGKALRDFIWMGDVVKLIKLSISNKVGTGTVYNLSSRQSFSIYQVANYVKKSYFKIFNYSLDILTNEEDTLFPCFLDVSNEKLLLDFDISFENMFEVESYKIISMLSES